MCFSRDGRRLAVARELDIDLYDALRGERLHTFRGHESYVNALGFTADGAKLVSASSETTLLVWDVAGVLARRPRAVARLDAEALKTCWRELSAADAQRAARSLAALVAAPRQSVPWLWGQLKPARAPGAGHVDRLLAKLVSDAFAVREQATRELEQLGPDAEAPLRRYLEGKLSAEARRRAERLLGRAESGGVSEPEHLRQCRALEVLERVGDNHALDLLRVLAAGSPEAWLTWQARSAVRRLRDYR
jgi:WD40 repeat protein